MSLRYVIGIHSCREALKARPPQELKKIYFKPEWQKRPALAELAHLARAKKLNPEVLPLKKINQIGESHQGVCVVVSARPRFNLSSAGKNSVVLILDRAQDPRNLGAIVRTAWLMAVDCVFIPSRQSAALSPSVIKTASGGAEHVPVEPKSSLRQCLRELKEREFGIYALSFTAKKSIWTEKFKGRTAFLLGGEASGFRKGLQNFCDEALYIPQKESSASYNVSVAAGIVLGELFRQKRGYNV